MSNFDRESLPYAATARIAHDLADRLKRVRPELHEEIDALQAIVTNSHRNLAGAQSSAKIAQAWCELSAAHQTLLDLRRHHKA